MERDKGRFTKGHGGGRPKGTSNKMSREIREMIREALDAAGGVDYLRLQAKENPSAFLTLVGKIVPGEVKAEIGGAVTIIMDGDDANA